MTALYTLLMLLPTFSYAYFVDQKDIYSGKTSFNGYTLGQFGDFVKNWKLVTVRFRKDSGEMRFVYANPVAWKAMEGGSKKFPDGSIFAKIAIVSQPDPAFESSLVPSGAKRIQFMVKDEKHSQSNGWGYALFDANGKTFPGEPKTAVVACHACHKLVPERDYVFSQSAALVSRGYLTSMMSVQEAKASALAFEKQNISALPNSIQAFLPKGASQIRVLVNSPLVENAFFGTLDEMRPALASEVKKHGLPTALITKDKADSVVVFLADGECPGKESYYVVITKSKSDSKPRRETFCQ